MLKAASHNVGQSLITELVTLSVCLSVFYVYFYGPLCLIQIIK